MPASEKDPEGWGRAAQKSFSDRSRELNSAQRQDPLDVVSQLPEALAD